MNNRIKLYVDFDSTICDSITAFCKAYSDRYKLHKAFIEPIPSQCKKWDFSDQCKLLQKGEVEDIFGSPNFFKYLKPMPNAIEVLKKLSKDLQLIIVSIGSYSNIGLKANYIKENLPFIKDAILIINEDCLMDKSIIRNGILIDDHMDNLVTSNAEIKICYGKKYIWNEKWQGLRCENWLEVKKLLLGGNIK